MRRIVIGLGNPSRGDDAAGVEVARRVRTVEAHVRMAGDYDLIDLWEGAEDVIIVDATRSGASAGTVRRFAPLTEPIRARSLAATTHSVGLIDTIELARKLDRLPSRLIVYGIEAADVALGASMTPPVEEAVTRVVEEIDRA